jgi:hypothetical protein
VKARAFARWLEFVAWQHSMRAALRKALVRLSAVLLSTAFHEWRQHTVRARTNRLQHNISDFKVRATPHLPP